MDINLKILSFNVLGLNKLVKRLWLAKMFAFEHADLKCLQETHLRAEDSRYLGKYIMQQVKLDLGGLWLVSQREFHGKQNK